VKGDNQEYNGGFLINRGLSEIVIEHPAGKGSFMSSSDGGGYSEVFERVIISKIKSKENGFKINISSDVGNASVISMSEGLTSVTALVTADPGPSAEASDRYAISVILMINAGLPQATMARAMVTSTEAVTCAFQELMIADPHSDEIASGSDSICVTVLSDNECGRVLYSAGKHSKLGELIGKTVKEATLSSMKNNGVTLSSQANILKRLERFGVTKNSFKKCLQDVSGSTQNERSDTALNKLLSDKKILASVSAVIHIADEIRSGLIPADAVYVVGRNIISATIREGASEKDLVNDLVLAIAMKAYHESH